MSNTICSIKVATFACKSQAQSVTTIMGQSL